jgi:hypothetical protein
LISVENSQNYDRQAFIKCTDKKCKNFCEITESDVQEATKCRKCGELLLSKKSVSALVPKNTYSIDHPRAYLAIKRELRRLERQNYQCPRCGEPVVVENLKCPLCGSELSQRETHLWVRRPSAENKRKSKTAFVPIR